MVLNSSRTLYPAVMLPGISPPQNSQELRKLCDHITESHILTSLEYVITGRILYICCLNKLIFLLSNVCHADSIVLASFDAPAYIILAKRYLVSNVNLIMYQNGIEQVGEISAILSMNSIGYLHALSSK